MNPKPQSLTPSDFAVKWKSLMRPWLAIVVVGLAVGACTQTTEKRISRYYEVIVTANSLGGHLIHRQLWGYSEPDEKAEPVLLCYQLKTYALADPIEGKKIFFVGRGKEEYDDKEWIFACDDGKAPRNVTSAVIQIGKQGGQIPLAAEYPRDFILDGFDNEPSGLAVTFHILQPEVGFGKARTIPISWQSVADRYDPGT